MDQNPLPTSFGLKAQVANLRSCLYSLNEAIFPTVHPDLAIELMMHHHVKSHFASLYTRHQYASKFYCYHKQLFRSEAIRLHYLNSLFQHPPSGFH
jgi:hypothetical protein